MRTRRGLSLLIAALLLAEPALAYQSPLSDTAVRDAYFLGRRQDGSLADFFALYSQFFPQPDSGPYIRVVSFYTPFAEEVIRSSQRPAGYSAQDAEQSHNPEAEVVTIRYEIVLTGSYGPFIVSPPPTRHSTNGLTPRPSDFWRDFEFEIFDGKRRVQPAGVAGDPQYNCSDFGCTLTGAKITLTFPANAFTSDTAEVTIYPPEDYDPVHAEFAIDSLR
ncbi:MAG TPA: hypothetical protein VMT51_13745 [Dongiaceae bacterium]|nr:hypothetical protein [Dongiaceae bacterium]